MCIRDREGDALEGQLLKAELVLDGDGIESAHIQWYRRKGKGPWQLVANVSETTYSAWERRFRTFSDGRPDCFYK